MRWLKESGINGGKERYSQGRIYLFISFCSFMLFNGILMYLSIAGNDLTEDNRESLQLVSTNLKWALGTFSLYILGGKGIGAFRDRSSGIENHYQHERNNHYRRGENPFNDEEEIE